MRKLTGGVVALCLGVALTAWADGAGDIDYRQKVMKAIGAHIGAAASIIKGKGGTVADLKSHAHALEELAKVSIRVFPAGSGPEAGKTEAKPEIWSDPEGFAKVSNDFVALAAQFSEAVSSGDMAASGRALGALGKGACAACHKAYRTKH